MTLVMQQAYNLAFIFDWNRYYKEFSVYRVTKDLPMVKSDFELLGERPPEGMGYIRAGIFDLSDFFGGDYGEYREYLMTLKTGRYHFRGTYWARQDYFGDHEYGLDLVACWRVR
jgi:hypothetical protein